jgi:hypothetical protein
MFGGLGLCLVAACGFDRPQAPSERLPVIRAVLVAGSDSQFFRLDWAVPADSPWVTTPRPIAPGDVALTLGGGGSLVPLVPRPGDPTTFVATNVVSADSAYTLEGTVAGIAVSATTSVPSTLTVQVPATDTIVIDTTTACVFASCDVPYALMQEGAAAALVEARSATGALIQVGRLSADSGAFQLRWVTEIRTLDFLAVDPNASAFAAGSPRPSIEGGFGVFGAALRVRKVVRWE